MARTRSSPLATVACLSFPFLATACADTVASGPCGPSGSGVPVVVAQAEGKWAREGRHARLVELWRAGGLREGEELVYPASISASPEGRLAVADFSLSEVVIVEPDGSWTGPWARRGDGPGELNTPVAVTWGRDGTLAVYDLTGSKVLFLRHGQPARADVAISREVAGIIYMAGELPWAGVQPNGAVLLQPPAGPAVPPPAEAAPATLRILRYAPGVEQPDTLLETLRPPDAAPGGLPAPGWPRLTAAIGTNGAIAIGGVGASYRITVHDSTGRVVREICSAADPLPLSPGERGAGAAEELAEELMTLRTAPLPDTLAPYGRVFWGARGRLWVQRSRYSVFTGGFLGSPGGPYDVFDPEGEYLGEVETPAAVRLQAAAGDTVFGFETGDLDETSVVAYQLVVE